MPEITSIIPVYFDGGMPLKYFKDALVSIYSQSLPPKEIIISDDTTNISDYPEFKDLMNDSPIPLRYLRNPGTSGMGYNSNFALAHVTTGFTHILHADDRLSSSNMYFEAVKLLETLGVDWGFFCGKVNERTFIPYFDPSMIFGKNSLGGPSGMFARTKVYYEYDANLEMLVDVEQYKRIYDSHGNPAIFFDCFITYGVGEWQSQNRITSNKFQSELVYVVEKSEKNELLAHSYLSTRGDSIHKIRLNKSLLRLKKVSYLVYAKKSLLLHFDILVEKMVSWISVNKKFQVRLGIRLP
jgi:glycosyltransferase involved in cell wall biosynthesis